MEAIVYTPELGRSGTQKMISATRQAAKKAAAIESTTMYSISMGRTRTTLCHGGKSFETFELLSVEISPRFTRVISLISGLPRHIGQSERGSDIPVEAS